MLKTEFISFLILSILSALFIFQFVSYRSNKSNKTNKIYKYSFWFSVALIFFYYLYLVSFQYFIWRNSGTFAQFLVPPYQNILYVFGYHFTRFALYYLISFIAAVFFLGVANYFNKKFSERFFEKEEPYLGALSIFLLGNPLWNYAWIYYVGVLLAVAVILSLAKGHLSKRSGRLSLRFLWLSLAILVILIKSFVSF